MSQEDPCALDDTIMHDRIKEIVEQHNIKVIVETGIFHGLSTALLADMVPVVYAVDNDPNNCVKSFTNLYNLGKRNVALCCGNSPDWLKGLIPHLPKETLFVLDAHWQQYWPLLDEIRSITPKSGIIVIHDFKVPNHPELGWDSYGGHELCYEYVKDVLTAWSPTHRVEYNDSVVGTQHPRGVAYIFPE